MITRTRTIRRDALPEAQDWQDTGCPDGLYPSCLRCPLPQCRFDDAAIRKDRLLAASRRALVERWGAEGVPTPEIARRLGISRRSVFRLAREVRESA